jgi:hypothetical protein
MGAGLDYVYTTPTDQEVTMAQNENVTRLRTIAQWLEELPDVVTTTPNIDSISVDFHLSNGDVDDWQEQAEAIVECGHIDADSKTVKNIGSFDTLDMWSEQVGDVCLFLPAYDRSTGAKIDHADHFNAEERA